MALWFTVSLPTTPSDCAVLQSQSQSLSSLSSHQNPSFHPPLSTAPPKTHPPPGSHKYTWKKKMLSDGLPHGTSQIAFRFLFEASLQKPPRHLLCAQEGNSFKTFGLDSTGGILPRNVHYLKKLGTRIFEILKIEIIGFRFLDSTWTFSIPSTTDSHPPIPKSYPLILSGSCTGAPS